MLLLLLVVVICSESRVPSLAHVDTTGRGYLVCVYTSCVYTTWVHLDNNNNDWARRKIFTTKVFASTKSDFVADPGGRGGGETANQFLSKEVNVIRNVLSTGLF